MAALPVSEAFSQGAVQQAGPFTAGHAPMYVRSGSNAQSQVQDAGPAAGGPVGLGLAELLLVNRSASAASGTGLFGAHDCRYSAPVTSASYYYLCFDPNAQGGGLIAYGAGGSATALPLQFIVNGSTYSFPFTTGGVVGPATTTIGNPACFNDTGGRVLAECTNVRKEVAGNTTFYVIPSGGNDTNTCLVNAAAPVGSTAGACATVQGAINRAYQVDSAARLLTIQIAAGSYVNSCNTVTGYPVGNGLLQIQGDAVTPGNVILTCANNNVFTLVGTNVAIIGMKMVTTGGAGDGVSAQASLVIINTVEFGSIIGSNITANSNSSVQTSGTVAISASATSHVHATANSTVALTAAYTLSNTPNFSAYFIGVAQFANVFVGGSTYAGTGATGTRCVVHNGATLNATGTAGSPTFLPGNAGCQVTQLGIYWDDNSPNTVGDMLGIFDANNHMRGVGTKPVLSLCGTSPANNGTDFSGTIVTGTGAPAACTLTFAASYLNPPSCVVTWASGNLALMQWNTTTTALTITQTATSSVTITYVCIALPGG